MPASIKTNDTKILLATSTASPYMCMEHVHVHTFNTSREQVLLISATQVFRNVCKVGLLASVFIPAVSHYTVGQPSGVSIL